MQTDKIPLGGAEFCIQTSKRRFPSFFCGLANGVASGFIEILEI
jgi:hypothetical protein